VINACSPRRFRRAFRIGDVLGRDGKSPAPTRLNPCVSSGFGRGDARGHDTSAPGPPHSDAAINNSAPGILAENRHTPRSTGLRALSDLCGQLTQGHIELPGIQQDFCFPDT